MPLDMRSIVRAGRIRAAEEICQWMMRHGYHGAGYLTNCYQVIFTYRGIHKEDYPRIHVHYKDSNKAGDWVIWHMSNGIMWAEGFGLEKLIEAIPKYIK